METLSLPRNFSPFSGASKFSNMPMDPITYEVFDVRNYLSEIQVAFDIVPAVEVASPNFALAGLISQSSFAEIICRNCQIKREVATKVNCQGFDEIELGGNVSSSVNTSWPGKSTRNFPPRLSIDQVQGFSFDFDVDVSDTGLLSLRVHFTLGAVGVNPFQTLGDIASRLSTELQGLSESFEGLTSSMQSTFNDASTMFSDIANSDRIQLFDCQSLVAFV